MYAGQEAAAAHACVVFGAFATSQIEAHWVAFAVTAFPPLMHCTDLVWVSVPHAAEQLLHLPNAQ